MGVFTFSSINSLVQKNKMCTCSTTGNTVFTGIPANLNSPTKLVVDGNPEAHPGQETLV